MTTVLDLLPVTRRGEKWGGDDREIDGAHGRGPWEKTYEH